jgi:hypothetical protein
MVVGWMEGSNPPTLIEMTPLKHLKVYSFLIIHSIYNNLLTHPKDG